MVAAMREVFAGNSEALCAFNHIFGPPGSNDYNKSGDVYHQSDTKPDKLYSTLQTIMQMIGDCRNKTVLDLGCGGTAFFTLEIARQGARMVYGIDNAFEQYMRASRKCRLNSNVRILHRDIFTEQLVKADLITAPYVLNYAPNTAALEHLLDKLYCCLRPGGKLAAVVDLPNNMDLKRFGAVKTLLGPKHDETVMQINLYNDEEHICMLNSMYYTQKTLENLLTKVGFQNIYWHKPIISPEGIRKLGTEFWDGYLEEPELGYITAERLD